MSFLVTNAEGWVCLDICRSLGKKGIKAGAASSDNSALSFSSKYCKAKHLYSDPLKSPDKFVEDLRMISESGGYEYLLPLVDPLIKIISDNRRELEKYIEIPISSKETIDVCDDKSKTIKLCQKLGLRRRHSS
jgi:predicted ATP-grasp superfamily ATP-dependent carboligase